MQMRDVTRRMYSWLPAAASLLFATAVLAAIPAAAEAEELWPNSPGSRHVHAFFTAVASRDAGQIKRLITHHYAPGATKSVDQEIAQHRSIHDQLGALDVRHVDQPHPSQVRVWAWSGKFEHWFKFVFALEAKPPYRIVTAQGSLSPPPTQSEAGLTASMNLHTMAMAAQMAMGAPALAIAVFQGGTLQQRVAMGVRAHGGSDPIDISDRFHLGSITKSMTATVMAKLVEQGVVSWSSQLGEARFNLEMQAVYRHVTLADLLRHRAGLVPFTVASEYPAQQIASAPSTFQEKRHAVAVLALRRPPIMPPGTAMAYSNAGYVAASVMAEQATGQSWEALIQAHLFKPWGLASCGFGWPVTRQRRHQPHGHFGTPGNYRVQQPGDYETAHNLRGSGGIHCSVTDLGRYGAIHLNGLLSGTPTLKAESVAWLHEPPRPHSGKAAYAAGWRIETLANGARHHFHEGTSGTFFAQLSLFPESHLVVAVVTNCGLHALPTVNQLVATIEAKWRQRLDTLDQDE